MSCLSVVHLLFALQIIVAVTSNVWDRDYWLQINKDELNVALKRSPNTNIAKNLVLAIGDGMGVTTTTAARVYRGQLTPGMLGEEALLSWDRFPYTGLSKTYCTDMMTTDSAASSTAYNSGVKTKYGTFGVDDTVIRDDCSSVAGATVESVLDYALAAGKSVGIISTDSVVGASPGATYAHTAQRDWSSDDEMPKEIRSVCKDIARQLIEDNLDIQVILGGGRTSFLPETQFDPEYPELSGLRQDGRDLAKEWLEAQIAKKRNAKYITNMTGFDEVKPHSTDYLFGLFEPKRMQEETIRRINKTEPSLAEMTEKAIQILSRNPKGFYLFIEGANIDKGHHKNRARKALEETLAFDDAVSKVMAMTSSEDTLVVVSADHSHGFVFGGYTARGQSILSIVNNTVKDTILDKANRTYTVLSYGTGPGYVDEPNRQNHTSEYYEEDQVYASVVRTKSGTHGGEDVEIFASGPMSHLFVGVHEQTFIAHGMAYAACIGTNSAHCESKTSTSSAVLPYHALIMGLLVWTKLH